jgi:hypothetical protein
MEGTTTRHGVFASRIIQSIFLKISRATWGDSAIRHPPYPVRKPLGLCVHVKGHTVVDPKGRIQEMMRLMGLENSGRWFPRSMGRLALRFPKDADTHDAIIIAQSIKETTTKGTN